MIVRLDNPLRRYDWGAPGKISEFLGRTASTDVHEAELWLGAHPDGSSLARLNGGRSLPLVDLIAASPSALLGEAVAARFGGLPYLMKVLAAGTPLSLQAHPTREQAVAGYDEEDRRGIAHEASNRNYRDRNHKPELLLALTPFEALCGFRPVADILATFERLGAPELRQLAERLRPEPDARGLRCLLEALLAVPPDTHVELIRQTLALAEAGAESPGPDRNHLRWIAELGHAFPGDVGIVMVLLLNYVKLEPGQALYLPAQTLHSYLSGLGVELMACSDNVLRGGLTTKHVDPAELLRVLTFEPMTPPIIAPTAVSPAEQVFITPAADFELSIISLAGHVSLAPMGPELLFCSKGTLSLETESEPTLALSRGESVFVGVGHARLELRGEATLFRATVGRAD